MENSFPSYPIIEVYKTEEGARQAFNFYRREGEPAATESFQEEGIFWVKMDLKT